LLPVLSVSLGRLVAKFFGSFSFYSPFPSFPAINKLPFLNPYKLVFFFGFFGLFFFFCFFLIFEL